MSTVLVVDDSLTDRRMAGALLAKDADLKVEYAEHGVAALARIKEHAPDLVVTDLIMPEMDGFELVAKIRKQHPLVPVILMTSVGSEDTAVKALQHGAASYVPKSSLPKELLDTVRRVLSVTDQKRHAARLMECLVTSDLRFELENDRALIAPLVGYLQETISKLGICDDTERVRIGVALEEALTNAIYHGNLEISSEIREQNFTGYYGLCETRAKQPPFSGRRVRIEARVTRDEARFVVRDEGQGFDPSSLPDPTDPANLERLSGRGVLLMRTFMDDVIYNDRGNEVTMVKRRRPTQA
jgi:CheY-like chemotaxis protein